MTNPPLTTFSDEVARVLLAGVAYVEAKGPPFDHREKYIPEDAATDRIKEWKWHNVAIAWQTARGAWRFDVFREELPAETDWILLRATPQRLGSECAA